MSAPVEQLLVIKQDLFVSLLTIFSQRGGGFPGLDVELPRLLGRR